jgi:hypothetical protein
MRDDNDVGKKPAIPAEGEGFAQGDEDDEEEQLAVEEEEEEEEEGSDYDLYRVERLLRLDQSNQLPRLHPFAAFAVAAVDHVKLTINKDVFESRLKDFLKTEVPSMPSLSAVLVAFLFDCAVDAHKHIKAWDILLNNARSTELERVRRYLRQELGRYGRIRLLLTKKRQTPPSCMSEWEQPWVEAFEEILERIEGQLGSARVTLDSFAEIRKSGSVEVESFILWLEKDEIRKQISGTAFARKLEVILAAFAYAAKLVPMPGKRSFGYVALIKQRVSRVSRSKEKQYQASAFFLRTMLATASGGATGYRPNNVKSH